MSPATSAADGARRPIRVLVTGAGGMLATAVTAAVRANGHALEAPSRAQLDVTDARAVAATISELRPELVINCAAWTDVDGAESDPTGAMAVNGHGAGHVARAAAMSGAHLVHISTDYVFDGRATRPYVESDQPAPTGVYGESKLEGERQVQAAGGSHAIVRTAWLFGAGGKNFVDTMLRLAGDGRAELKVVADQRGCPTWTGHLAPALVEIGERRLTGVLHVAGGGSCTWNELAREAFAQAGLDVLVGPATTQEIARPAPRPAWSVLGTEREDAPRLPAWQEGVRGHLAQQRAPAEPASAGPATARQEASR